MKKVLLFLLGAVVFVGLVVLILVKVLGPTAPEPAISGDPFKVESQPPSNEVVSPSEFAKNAFRWYLGESSNDFRFAATQAFKSERVNWFSPTFIAFWDDERNDTGSDHLHGAQDIPVSWVQSVQAATIEETPTTAVVVVSLGIGADFSKRRVHLIKDTEGHWRIDSVEAAS